MLVLFTHHASTKRAVPVSYKCVGHHQRDGVRVGPTNRFHSKSNMSEGHFVVTHTDLKQKQTGTSQRYSGSQTHISSIPTTNFTQTTGSYLTSCEVTGRKSWGSAFISARKLSKVILGQTDEFIMTNS